MLTAAKADTQRLFEDALAVRRDLPERAHPARTLPDSSRSSQKVRFPDLTQRPTSGTLRWDEDLFDSSIAAEGYMIPEPSEEYIDLSGIAWASGRYGRWCGSTAHGWTTWNGFSG